MAEEFDEDGDLGDVSWVAYAVRRNLTDEDEEVTCPVHRCV